MVKLIKQGAYYMEDKLVKESCAFMTSDKKEKAVKNTISYSVLKSHGAGEGETVDLAFDFYVSEVEEAARELLTAKDLGMSGKGKPYYVSSDFPCLPAEYGATEVPSDLADINRYLLEKAVKSGELLLSSKRGTYAGALGAISLFDGGLGIAEGLCGGSYESPRPEIYGVQLRGKPKKGVGGVDVGLAIAKVIGAKGFAAGKIFEFFGAGAGNLSMEFRFEIDRILAGAGCLSTVWTTDDKTQEFFACHGREKDFKRLAPQQPAYYDGGVVVDLSDIESMILVGEGWENVCTVKEFSEAPDAENYTFLCGDIVGGYEELAEIAEIVREKNVGTFRLSVAASSSPVLKALVEGGYAAALLDAGASLSSLSPFSGNCCELRYLGEDREELQGSCILDPLTLAATAISGGKLTPAVELDYKKRLKKYAFAEAPYKGIFKGNGTSKSLSEEGSLSLRTSPLPDELFVQIDGGNAEVTRELAGRKLGTSLSEGAACGIAYSEPFFFVEQIEGDCVCAVSETPIEREALCILTDYGVPALYLPFKKKEGDFLYIKGLREKVKKGEETIEALLISKSRKKTVTVNLPPLSEKRRARLLAGGYIAQKKGK